MCNGAYHPLSCPACAAWDWKGRSQESEGESRSQKSGVRGKEQESEVRSQNEEHLVPTFCSPLRAFRLLLAPSIFLPDRAAAGHAIIFPRFPVTISRVMESTKEKPQSL